MSRYVDRVMETSTTTGTGNITLAGAVTGYQTWNTGLGTDVFANYAIVAVDANGTPTGEWEVGEGYLSASTTLVRSVPTAGSAATPVSFTAGTKRVFLTYSANEAINAALAVNNFSGNPMP